MKPLYSFFFLSCLFFMSCSKEKPISSDPVVKPPIGTDQFITYTIFKGNQYCDKNALREFRSNTLAFTVIFDSSSVYTTQKAENQTDINKLFGFSDNNEMHHQYSARFGWRWDNGKLRLFAYIYNGGVRSFRELGIAELNKEIRCAITVAGDQYIFSANGKITAMPRAATTPVGTGYRLYPYFGGDEVAPHDITIRMKEESLETPQRQ